MSARNLDTSESVVPVVIVGAGPTGLSAAYHLGRDSILLEQADRVGGWCRSIEDNGFTFDMAGHIMFSNDPYVHEMYQLLLGDNVHWQDREAWIYSKRSSPATRFREPSTAYRPRSSRSASSEQSKPDSGSSRQRSRPPIKGPTATIRAPNGNGGNVNGPLMKANGTAASARAYSGAERRLQRE